MALSPLLAGYVLNANRIWTLPELKDKGEQWYNYTPFYYMFMGFAIVSALIAAAMWYVDSKRGNKLDKKMTDYQKKSEAGIMSSRLKASFANDKFH